METRESQLPVTGAWAEAEPEYAAFLGIDWGDSKHCWSMQVAGESKRERGELKHSPEAIEVWMVEVSKRFPQQPVAVCLEQSRGALLATLSKYQQLVLYPLHPAAAKDFRKALYPSGKKSDVSDADVVLEYLLSHRDRLRRWRPDTGPTRQLQFLVEDRRRMVDQKTRLLNRLGNRLKVYFPQALEWFGSADSQILWQFLERWPDLESVRKARRSTLAAFLGEQDKRLHPPPVDALWSGIRNAMPATHDEAVIESSVMYVEALVPQLRQLRDSLARYEKRIDELTKTHPDFPVIRSFPAAGQAMAPRLIVALGTQRDRFATVHELQSFSGIAPVQEASGKRCWIHVRRACSKFVRQTFHEWAQHTIAFCDWARTYYDRQRARGKQHHAAVRSLAFKWIRILFRCWKDRTLYDDAKYTAAMQQRSCERKQAARSNTVQPNLRIGIPSRSNVLEEIVWKNQAGFSRPALKTT